MEVTFRYTDEDTRALFRQFPWAKRYGFLLWTFLYLTLGMTASTILPALCGFWIAISICWAAYGLMLLFVLYRTLTTDPAVEFDSAQMQPVTLRLEDGYWHTSNASVRNKHDWSCIQRVETSDTHLFLFIEPMKAYVISLSSFKSPSYVRPFVERLKAKAGGPIKTGNLPDWQVTEHDLLAGNAEDVIRVTYQATVEELAAAEFQRPNVRQLFNTGLWISFCVLLLASVFYGISMEAGWFMLSSFVGAILMSAALIAMNAHQRRLWRQHLPPQRLQPVQITASPRGICALSSTEECHVEWEAYTGFQSNDSLVMLQGRVPNIEPLTIPRRAFASEQDLARFEALAQEHIQPEALAAQIVPATPETGNPYQPPLQET